MDANLEKGPKPPAHRLAVQPVGLVLARTKSARRTNALYQALSNDFLLREQFITDPASILSEYVGAIPLAGEHSSSANQLLYAVVSNRAMLAWLRDRADLKPDEGRSRPLGSEFARAVAQHGDAAVIASLMRCGSGEAGATRAAIGMIDAAIALFGGFRQFGNGTEYTPGTGTEYTPGTGTEATIAGGTEYTPGTGTGTESTPGTGTEYTPGTGTGTGTESTPGTGTEASIGDFLDRRGWGEFEVTFRALVSYAIDLRKLGVLHDTGLTIRR